MAWTTASSWPSLLAWNLANIVAVISQQYSEYIALHPDALVADPGPLQRAYRVWCVLLQGSIDCLD